MRQVDTEHRIRFAFQDFPGTLPSGRMNKIFPRAQIIVYWFFDDSFYYSHTDTFHRKKKQIDAFRQSRAKVNTDAESYIVCRADRFDEHGGNEELWRAADELHRPRCSAAVCTSNSTTLTKIHLSDGVTSAHAHTHTHTQALSV